MGDLRVEDSLPESLHGLCVALLEGHEGKASAAARHVIAHDRNVYYLSKPLEIVLHVSLYTQ